MTTKVTITNEKPGHKDVIVKIINPPNAAVLREIRLGQGSTLSEYVHSGQSLRIDEVED